MTDYTNNFGGAAKDSANDIVLGADFDTEYNSLATHIATKANTASPSFTGTVTSAGKVAVNDTTDSTSGTTGSVQTDGGGGFVKDIISDASIKAKGTTDASSDTTGALQSAGGLGIAKTAWLGQDIVLDERADHAATSAAGNGIVWVKSDAPSSLMYTDDTAVDHQLTNPVVSGHIRAGNTQIWDGEGADTTAFNISGNIVASSFETIGPTGSNATNIWTDMDQMPDNATILIAMITMSAQSTGTGNATVNVQTTHGDDSTPSLGAGKTRASMSLDTDAANHTHAQVVHAYIPLGATNQDFHCAYTLTNADTEAVTITYRGFMTD